jgi:hypothetical protein
VLSALVVAVGKTAAIQFAYQTIVRGGYGALEPFDCDDEHLIFVNPPIQLSAEGVYLSVLEADCSF